MSDKETLYGVVDAARDPLIFALVRQCPGALCLFDGATDESLLRHAPYLVNLSARSPLQELWVSQGHGKDWGIAMRSHLDMNSLKRHLKKFLVMQLPDGSRALFRFYDPRVWNVHWASCPEAQRARWLSGISVVYAEAG